MTNKRQYQCHNIMQFAKTTSSVIKILALSSTDQDRAEIYRPEFDYMV